MKRRYSICEESLPSPEYSEPEYSLPTSYPKKARIKDTSHEFIDIVDDSLLEFIEKDGTISRKKYKVKTATNLVLVFFGIMNDFLDPIR